MTEREALKLALVALDIVKIHYTQNRHVNEAITAIKEALAQPEQEPVAIMREMLEVQGQHGNWNYDSYMHGLYNGMEYMVALAEKREPKFRDAPDEWLAKYEVKRDNFNSTEPLTEATPPQRKPLTDGSLINEGTKKPEQEPVACVDKSTMELAESVGLIGPTSRTHDLHQAIQRFHDLICANATVKGAQMAADAIREAAPPQRTWVGLTDEEINDLVHNHDDFDGLWEFTDAVEAKLKEKNT